MKGYIYSDQIPMFGHKGIIGYGTDDFYVKEIDRKLANKTIIEKYNKTLNDEFVKQCDENISGGVPSYDTRNFEVFCSGGCSKSRIVKHDSYKVYVSGY